MNKYLKIGFWILFGFFGFWLYFFSGLEKLLLNLIILNILAYILRSVFSDIAEKIFSNLISRYIFIVIIDIVWLSFVFMLISYFSPTFFLAILSFLIIAISLTFKDRINNIASGLMIISSSVFEPGDLIETNNTQGVVQEMKLNYTIIKEFDGIRSLIPNESVYDSSITKFTHKILQSRDGIQEGKKGKIEEIKTYASMLSKKLLGKESKITTYTKNLELIGRISPITLDKKFSKIFDIYEKKLGLRPTYNVNNTVAERLSVTLRINSIDPLLILKFTDALLRDILYEINSEDVFLNWKKKEIN